MAALANIVLGDKTPTNRTFKPAIKNGLLVELIADYAASPALHPRLSIGMRAPKAGQSRKVTLKISVPYEVVTDDATTIEYDTAFIDLIAGPNSSVGSMQDLRAFASNALLNAIISDSTDSGMFPY